MNKSFTFIFFLFIFSSFSFFISATPTPLELKKFTFHRYYGFGTGALVPGTFDIIDMSSLTGSAMDFTLCLDNLKPNTRYRLQYYVSTDKLVSIDAYLTGMAYFSFFDYNMYPGGWQPQYGELAPVSTHWTLRNQTFFTPTIMNQTCIHLAFAAHSWTAPRMTRGSATGRASFTNVTLEEETIYQPLNSQIIMGDQDIQQAIKFVYNFLSNSQLNENFTVSAHYTISDNMSPDLFFGLQGIRRAGYYHYIQEIIPQWLSQKPDLITGKFTYGRVMGQVLWPLGIDTIFSFTGDTQFLKQSLPYCDSSLQYLISKSDDLSLVTLIPTGQGVMGGGADWVDWYHTRLDGRTLMFHLWYCRCLDRIANLHEEFQDTFGNITKAKLYRETQNNIFSNLKDHYWKNSSSTSLRGFDFNGWQTNIDYTDEGLWMDDQFSAVYHKLSDEYQTKYLYNMINQDITYYYGKDLKVPTRWTQFIGPKHGPYVWFGRVGAIDLLNRFKNSDPNIRYSAFQMFKGIGQTFLASHDIYEAYTLEGSYYDGTKGYGTYFEHIGGYLWALVEGIFGIDFNSNSINGNTFTITPRFLSSNGNCSVTFMIRGFQIDYQWLPDSSSSDPRQEGAGKIILNYENILLAVKQIKVEFKCLYYPIIAHTEVISDNIGQIIYQCS